MWLLIFFGTAAFFSLCLSFTLTKKETVNQRLQRLVTDRKELQGYQSSELPAEPEAEEAKRSLRSARKAFVSMVEQATSGHKFSDRLGLRLLRAGWQWRPPEFLAAQLIMAVLGLAIAMFFVPSLIWLFPLIGWSSPLLLLGRAEKQKIRLFEQQLPDALTIISNALRSGFSFLQAMEVVSREMPDPIAREFGLILRETRVNIPLEESLNNLVQRVKSEDLDLAVTAVLIQRQVGGNLAEVLDKIGVTIKERIRLQGEIRTLSTQGRMSGWVISLLPVVLGVMMQVISPGFLDPMFTHPIGWAMLAVGALMLTLGILVIRNMVNLEV